MKIDGNEKETAALAAHRRGDKEEGTILQDEFVAEFMEFAKEGKFCPCVKLKCKYHGKCMECVAIHRGHRHHLPNCFRDMVNAKLRMMSELTEHSMPTVDLYHPSSEEAASNP